MSHTDKAPDGGTAQPTVEQAALSPDAAVPPIAAPSPNGAPASAPAERPELVVGAAFAGGFALALVLRRLVR